MNVHSVVRMGMSARRGRTLPGGFTLVELLVVIAIIAILASILFPVFAQARSKARQATALSNLRQIAVAALMYAQDYDETLPMTMESVSTGRPVTIGYWAVSSYQASLDPYIRMGRGIGARGSVWWDPSDPDRNKPAMWGSFVANGLLTAMSCPLARIGAPAETVFSTLRADQWEQVTGVTPPTPLPPPGDAFWLSEYFDMCLDLWDESVLAGSPGRPEGGEVVPPCSVLPSAPECGSWDQGIAQRRYQGRTLAAFADGHAGSVDFRSTFRSREDNQWDLR